METVFVWLVILIVFVIFLVLKNVTKDNTHTSNDTTADWEKEETRKPPEKEVSSGTVPAIKQTLPSERIITDEFLMVRHLIEESDYQIIVVTGGAGTGKTTMIDWLVEKGVVNAVVAPTGAAALNCRGKTLHSFFQIPPRIILPKDVFDSRLRQETVSILSHTYILVIDEISMVRADTLDAIDKRLRAVLDQGKPFGGMRVLMVGDPYQLPPVVGGNDKILFSPHRPEHQWESGWFFDSKAFQCVPKVKYMELTHIFRQEENEKEYIHHLNHLRKYSNLEESIRYFNTNCIAESIPKTSEMLFITTDNATASKTNHEELAKIQKDEKVFKADASGVYAEMVRKSMQFPSKDDPDAINNMKNLPAPYELKLKVGALVMLLVNDAGKNFVNGTTAVVLDIEKESIKLKLSNGNKVTIGKNKWTSEKLVWNSEKEEFERIVDGEFIQFPLTLAWAITTHKSQGRTLNSVFINFKNNAFAPGQTYVALSRTRSIKDLKLSRPLSVNDFKQDTRLNEWRMGIIIENQLEENI